MLFILTAGTAVQAQYFAGGSFSLTRTGGSTKIGDTSTDKESSTSFSLNPKGGYFLSEDFAVGLGIGINTSREKTPGSPEVIDKSTGFSIKPFARYYALEWNNFSLFGVGQLGYSTSSSKEESGSVTTDGPTTNTIALLVHPAVAYNLNEKVALEAFINGFNLGYSHSTEKTGEGATEIKERTSSFNLGASMDNILTSGALTVGVIVNL